MNNYLSQFFKSLLAVFFLLYFCQVNATTGGDDVLDISKRGLMFYEQKYSMIMDNITNAKTPGYKEKSIIVESGDLVSKVSIMANFITGPLKFTGNSMDLALEGNGFFTIMTAEGEMYVRDGRLKIDPYHNLVTVAGNFPIVGQNGLAISIPNNATMTADSDGNIKINGEIIDKLKIVFFKDKRLLKSYNSAAFFTTEANNKMDTDQPYRVIQGAYEESNTSLPQQLIEMDLNSRKYEAMTKVIQERMKLIQGSIDAAQK